MGDFDDPDAAGHGAAAGDGDGDGATVGLLGQAAGLVALAFDSVEGLSGTQASQELATVGALISRAEALRIALVDQVRKSEIWREQDPNGTPASFLRREHSLDHSEARADLRAAAAFDAYPCLREAAQNGKLTRRAVDAMLSVGLRNPTRQAMFGDFVPIFTELAGSVPLSTLKKALRVWGDQVDPLATAADEDDAYRQRYLHVSQLGDGVKLDGFFPAEQGMKLMAALNAALTSHRKTQSSDSSPESSLPEPADTSLSGFGVVNSSSQQRADAFIACLIEPALSSGILPTCGGAAPHVVVTIPMERMQNPTRPVDLEALKRKLLYGRAELDSASLEASNGPGEQLLSAQNALRLSCDATVQRIVLSPESVPLDIGRSNRLIPADLRKALILRDGGCVFPDCDKPPGWTEAHHVQHWSKGGPTKLDNLALLCSRHHHDVHSSGHEITFDPAGRPRIKLRQTVIR